MRALKSALLHGNKIVTVSSFIISLGVMFCFMVPTGIRKIQFDMKIRFWNSKIVVVV